MKHENEKKERIDNLKSESRNKGILDARRITHTFLSGNLSATLVIPIEIARRNGLDKPSNVIVEEIQGGILIRRIEI